MIKKVENTVPPTYVIFLTMNKLLERFMKENTKKQIKNSLKLKKVSMGKMINYILNGKSLIFF